MKIKLILTALCGIFSLITGASTESYGGYTWTFSRDGKGVKITGVSPELSGEVVFPSRLGGLSVVNIEWSEEIENDTLTKVWVPATLADGLTNGLVRTSVWSVSLADGGKRSWPKAFTPFEGLAAIEIEGTPSNWKSVDGAIFTKDGKTLYFVPRGKTWLQVMSPMEGLVYQFDVLDSEGCCMCGGISTIHDNLANIYDIEVDDIADLLRCSLYMGHPWYLWQDGEEVRSIELDADIPDEVFYNCQSLESVSISSSVKKLGGWAFACCENLQEVSGGSGLSAVGNCCFEATPYLDNAEPGLLMLGGWALDYIGELPSVLEIPEGVRGFSFGLYDVDDLTLPESCMEMSGTVRFYGSVLRVPSLDFYLNKKFRIWHGSKNACDYNPEEDQAYYDLYAAGNLVTDVVVPASVVEIQRSLFAYCGSIQSVTFESGIAKIGESAFSHCPNLMTVALPQTLKWIGDSAFYNSADADFTLPSSLDYLGANAFYNTYAYTVAIETADEGDGIAYLGNWCLGCVWDDEYCPKSVTIRSGTRGIMPSAFGYCRTLTQVTIPSSVISIGSYAFADSGLTSVALPSALKRIGTHAFASSKLTALPKLPSSLERVGEGVFRSCESGVTPAYAKLPKGMIVKDGWLLDYKRYDYYYDSADERWYTNEGDELAMPSRVVVPSSIKHIADGDNFDSMFGNVSEIVLPSGLLTIGSDVFSGKIAEVTIPSSVTAIGSGAFGGGVGEFSFLGKPPQVVSSEGDDDLYLAYGGGVGYFATGTAGWTDGMDFYGLKMEGRVLSNGKLVEAVKVTVEQEGEGTVTGASAGAYLSGTKLTFKAAPAAGYVFTGWFVDDELVSSSASYAYIVPSKAETLTAVFELDEIWYDQMDDIECNAGEKLEIPLWIESGSALTVKATGLPKGLSFDAKNMVITGTPSAPGVYAVQILATNKSKNTETISFVITVANFVSDYFTVEEYVELDPGVEMESMDLSSCGIDFANGETLAVSGLPKGLSWNAKTFEIVGTPTVPGAYTVTFTGKVKVTDTKGKASSVTTIATATWRILDFPLLTLTPTTDTDAAGGSVTGGGNYLPGTKATLRATAKTGYVFAGWFGLDASRVSVDLRSPTLTYVTGTADEEILAYFVPKSEDAASLNVALKTARVCDGGRIEYDEWQGESYVGVLTTQQVAVASLSLPTVKVTGLPAGLKFNSKTYEIYGIPTRTGDFTVTVKATNASGVSVTERFDWTILPLPEWAVGTFVGRLGLNIHPDGQCYEGGHEDLGGVLTMTVGKNGRISGKLQSYGKMYSFTSSGFVAQPVKENSFKTCPSGHHYGYSTSRWNGQNYERVYWCETCGCFYSEEDMADINCRWSRFIAEIALKACGKTVMIPVFIEEQGAWENAGTGIGNGGVCEEDGWMSHVSAPASICECWVEDFAQTLSSRKDVATLTTRTYAKCLTGEDWPDELGEDGWLTVKASAAGRLTLVGRIQGNAVTATSELAIGELGEDDVSVWSFLPLAPNKRTGFSGMNLTLESIIREGVLTGMNF